MYCEKCGKYSGRYPLCKDCYYEDEESEWIEDEDDEDPFEELVCPICGQPTSVYMGNARKDRLCREHGRMLKEGKIRFLESVKKYIDTNTNKILNTPSVKPTETKPVESANTTEVQEQNDIPEWLKETTNNKTTEVEQTPETIIIDKGIRCLTCGYETEGKLFCKKCFARYSGKEILIKIKNCREIVPLDDFYEGYFECDDGHVVKSMAERDIDNYLFEKQIRHGYEVPIKTTDSKGKTVILHPDFCIFDENNEPIYYIEYWGYDDNNRDYTKTKKFKIPLYEKMGITLININAKHDLRNLKLNLKFKLANFKNGIINFLNE